MINYFSLLLPALLIYMAKYYIMKHDYKNLQDSWQYLLNRQDEIMKIVKDNGINLINPNQNKCACIPCQQLSENEEEDNAI